ncbi:MAG: DUF4190 domain-containing protein [Arachnia sp.]
MSTKGAVVNYYQPRSTNGLAIATLVTGICGLAVVPIVLGHLSLGQIRRTGEDGQALAVVGLVLGYLTAIGYAIAILFVLLGGLGIFLSGR